MQSVAIALPLLDVNRRKQRLLHVSLDSTNQDVREKHLGRQTNGIPSQTTVNYHIVFPWFSRVVPFCGSCFMTSFVWGFQR